MKNLLIFGDSWPQGSELKPNQRPFGDLLASKLNIPMMNWSAASTSIPHLILQLRDAVTPGAQQRLKKFDHGGSDAIFFLTSPERDVIWKHGLDKELHINPNHPTDFDVRWYSEFWTPELSSFRVNTTLLALQKLCEIHGIRDHYIWGWDPIELWPDLDVTKFWKHGKSSVLDLFLENDTISCNGTLMDYIANKENKFVYPNGGHPNQRGHQLIANELEAWLVHTI
jgi:hypothetical protein